MLCRLLAVNDVDTRRWVFRPLREETFASSSIKGDTFRNVISGLQALAYVDVAKDGSHKKQLCEYFTDIQNEYDSGIATRFRATCKLKDQASSFGAHVEDYRRHFKKRPNFKQVTLKASSQCIQWKKFSKLTLMQAS